MKNASEKKPVQVLMLDDPVSRMSGVGVLEDDDHSNGNLQMEYSCALSV